MPGESQQAPVSAPDPTVLTTEQLLREIENVTVLFDSKVRCIEELTQEKFEAVKEQLALVERQRVEQKADTKTAVVDALASQKEAITKTEASTSEQLRQLATNFRTEISGVQTTLNDVKDRVVKIESMRLGGQEATTDRRLSNGASMAIAGFALTMILGFIAVVGFVINAQP